MSIARGAIGNTIGGTTAGTGNVISGNLTSGGQITVAGSSANPSKATSSARTRPRRPRAQREDGVDINAGATNDTIGPNNVISGNMADGVNIGGAGTTGNLVVGNLIGSDGSDTTALGNGQDGVSLSSGGNTVGEFNVIGGNFGNGIVLASATGNLTSATGNLVEGSFIGVTRNGTTILGNMQNGIFETGDSGSTIGGTTARRETLSPETAATALIYLNRRMSWSRVISSVSRSTD